MITADAEAALAALSQRLERRAAALAEARARSAKMARRGDARRWRRPDLLWPLFTPKFNGGLRWKSPCAPR